MNNLQNLEPATLGFNSSGQAHQLLAQTAAQAILYLLILIIALPLNILVLVLVYKCRPLRSVPNIFVASLALADFLIALLGLPAIVIATVAQSWPFGVTLCQTSGFLTFSLRNVSILSVAGIAVDRYYVIARPFILVVTREKAKKMIVFLWWNGLLCGIPPLFGLGLYKFSPSRCLCDYSWLDGGSSLAYGIYLFIWIYVMSLLLVTISYYFIYRVTSEHVKQKAQRFASSFPPEQEATSIPMEFSSFRLLQSSLSRKWASFISSNSNFNTSSSSDVAMESKTTRTIVAVVTTYLVTWVPYFIVNFHPGSAYGRKVPKMLDFLVTWLTFVNCALNPVLYAILNRQFRRCLRENIGLWFGVFTQQAPEGVPAPAAIAQNGGIGKRPTSNENSPPPFSVSRELPRSVSPTFLRESSLYTSSPNPCSVFSQRRASPAQRPHSHIAV